MSDKLYEHKNIFTQGLFEYQDIQYQAILSVSEIP